MIKTNVCIIRFFAVFIMFGVFYRCYFSSYYYTTIVLIQQPKRIDDSLSQFLGGLAQLVANDTAVLSLTEDASGFVPRSRIAESSLFWVNKRRAHLAPSDCVGGTDVVHGESYDEYPLCKSWYSTTQCVVASAGVGARVEYEASAILAGCSAFLIDPTGGKQRGRNIALSQEIGATFVAAGLGTVGGSYESENMSKPLASYGDSVIDYSTPTYSVEKLLERSLTDASVGYSIQNVKLILKIDCEGCEWRALSNKAVASSLRKVNALLIEFHISDRLGVATDADVDAVAQTFNNIVYNGQLKLVSLWWKVCIPKMQHVPKRIVQAGHVPGVCCYVAHFEH